jgi:toxin-antitoxin system PIN domain toxin
LIIVDANILLYAYGSLSPHHAEARAWIEEVFSGTQPIGLPWQTIEAFLRIMTNPRLPGVRFSVEEAVEVVDDWIAQPNVRLIAPGDNHWPSLRHMLVDGQAPGPLVSDAQLAALTMEYGGVLYTTDRDFARFPGLRWKNPLQ